ncbi:hypothetical protein TVAG_250060 [Trichomonas vaginalis G3]|uniref:Uncharacterized protein n=1 Tax=Trichomonas vaginalis (strain ATCC PRA-98 / G3) TaxID=412133 RepID=A2DCK9_TRIV3|nr:hypothetical protein TVAGG3_0956260 [Trichomonas vaginalis G3]EAY21946.1 hypothetical protein TVAG_250060 [Trichomonas vaginalis G3]KAI5487577.1 hypothetical protein TVAGG3_0956260 [Trichomonas vaginalis G3]|eukprot:XP_001582932.1 hypothetical protein [Trichomonas vaginalis G3]
MNYIIFDDPNDSNKNFPKKHLISVYATVTVQNNFKSVEQLLHAVSAETDYKLQYSISKEITILKDYQNESDSSEMLKNALLFELNENKDENELVNRSVYYVSYNEDIRNMIIVYRRCDTHNIQFTYLEGSYTFLKVNWNNYVLYHELPYKKKPLENVKSHPII